jgi:tetratricopeptide (TPR) repeat protein
MGARHLRSGLRLLGWTDPATAGRAADATAAGQTAATTETGGPTGGAGRTAIATMAGQNNAETEAGGPTGGAGQTESRTAAGHTTATTKAGGPVGGIGRTAHPELAARLLISLAHAEAEQGRTELGLRLLDGAEPLVAPDERGVLLQQRGLLLLRTGRADDALALLDAAVPLLAEAGDSVVLARTLLNRSALHLDAGRIGLAREDLRRCERIARANDLDLVIIKAVHNLGYCQLLSGDIPAALEAFEESRQGCVQHAPGMLLIATVDKARALLSAGLASEAGRELDASLESFRRQRLSQDYAEAELTRAQAALEADDFAGCQDWATRAERRFRRRGNRAWAALAALMRLRADFQTWRTAATAATANQPSIPATPPATTTTSNQPATTATSPGTTTTALPPAFASRAARLAGRLRRLRLAHQAEVADLLAVRALVAAGRIAEAQRRAGKAGSTRTRYPAPIETRLLRRLTRAELAGAQGRRGETFAHLRAGLADLREHRNRLGSLDFQTSTGALGDELGQAGLDAVLDDGSPGLIFAWSERSRAQAFRSSPVRAPDDPETAEAVAELRQLSQTLRAAELQGRSEPQIRSRCSELERKIRERGWWVHRRGSDQASKRRDRDAAGDGTERADRAAPTLGEVTAELAAAGRIMVSILVRHGQLRALLIGDGPARTVRLGDYAVAAEAQKRLIGDLNALAGRNPPARLAAVISESIRRQVAVLTEEIVVPLRPMLGDHDVVVVPTRALFGLPWGLLPDLHGRPVTVAPSASAWLFARRSRLATPHPAGAAYAGDAVPLLVAGPDLAHANREIEEIARIYPTSKPLYGTEATVEATLRTLEGAPIAHLAAHGHHERDNVLFSRLDLADGPLMAYDVQRLTRAPQQVVLSACDVGRTVVRTGDEILGFTAALLYAGTASVVSCLARIPDDAAAAVMVAYHRAIATGAEPARALAAASLTQPLASFACFGCG